MRPDGYWEETPEWREAYHEALKVLDAEFPAALAVEPTPLVSNAMLQAMLSGQSQDASAGLQNGYAPYQALMNAQMQNSQPSGYGIGQIASQAFSALGKGFDF